MPLTLLTVIAHRVMTSASTDALVCSSRRRARTRCSERRRAHLGVARQRSCVVLGDEAASCCLLVAVEHEPSTTRAHHPADARARATVRAQVLFLNVSFLNVSIQHVIILHVSFLNLSRPARQGLSCAACECSMPAPAANLVSQLDQCVAAREHVQ